MDDSLFGKYGKKVAAGEILFKAGEEGKNMYVIRSGSVRVFMESNGVEKTLAVLGPGEFVGEMSLLNSRPRSASAVMAEDGELLGIESQVLEEMIAKNTEIAVRLMKKLARRLEATNTLVQVLIFRDPKERVIENFKRLVRIHGLDREGKMKLAADYDAMAEQVGLELHELKDVISRLVRAGLVVEEDGSWVIDDAGRLGEFLQFLKSKERFK